MRYRSGKARARRGEVPERILIAAISELEAVGLFEFSLKSATDAAEVHMAQAYGRWSSKAELLQAVADDLEDGLVRSMRQALRAAEGSQRLYAAVEAYIRRAYCLRVSALMPAIRTTIGNEWSPAPRDWDSPAGQVRARKLAKRAARELAAPPRLRTRDVFLDLAHEFCKGVGRPDVASALGAALYGLVEGIGLQTAREARSRPVENFIFLAHRSTHALLTGFLALPKPGAEEPQPQNA